MEQAFLQMISSGAGNTMSHHTQNFGVVWTQRIVALNTQENKSNLLTE